MSQTKMPTEAVAVDTWTTTTPLFFSLDVCCSAAFMDSEFAGGKVQRQRGQIQRGIYP